MKQVTISNRKMQALGHQSLVESYIISTLIAAGFDLVKPYKQSFDQLTDMHVYQQEDEEDEADDPHEGEEPEGWDPDDYEYYYTDDEEWDELND